MRTAIINEFTSKTNELIIETLNQGLPPMEGLKRMRALRREYIQALAEADLADLLQIILTSEHCFE